MTARAPGAITLAATGLLLLRVFASPAGETSMPRPRDPHVRPADEAAERLLTDGIRRSYTIARLADAIDRSDVIAYLQVALPSRGWPQCHLRLVGSAQDGRWRYASIVIDAQLLADERLEMLGHELQHVVEVAEARDVIDDATLEAFYERTGYPSERERSFETRGAVLVQMEVGRELLANRDSGVLPAAAGPAQATPEPRRLYDAYCAVCHGRNGRGRGEARPLLSAAAPDLTLLTHRNGGTFPRSAVEECIRASQRHRSAAGQSEMPVWTVPLSSEHGDGAAAHADTIAEYVESLQRRSQ